MSSSSLFRNVFSSSSGAVTAAAVSADSTAVTSAAPALIVVVAAVRPLKRRAAIDQLEEGSHKESVVRHARAPYPILFRADFNDLHFNLIFDERELSKSGQIVSPSAAFPVKILLVATLSTASYISYNCGV